MADSVVDKLKDVFEGITGDRKTLLKILSVILILLIAAVLRIHDSSKADITIESAEVSEETVTDDEADGRFKDICVDIGGAVAEPGVYHVSGNTRLYEVIDMAGGLLEDADTDSVNRASYVEDGQKIIIPVKGSGSPGGTTYMTGGASTWIAEQGMVNINTASVDELKTLNGIGDVIAERIVEYRASHVFKSKEDIMSVDGIGKGIYEKIKDRIIC